MALPGASEGSAKPLRTTADVAALHPSELLPYWEAARRQLYGGPGATAGESGSQGGEDAVCEQC